MTSVGWVSIVERIETLLMEVMTLWCIVERSEECFLSMMGVYCFVFFFTFHFSQQGEQLAKINNKTWQQRKLAKKYNDDETKPGWIWASIGKTPSD